jgi:putative endonuclease
MPSEALAKEGRRLHYVYLHESLSSPDERYIGSTGNLRGRLAEHNAGKSKHASKFMPWRTVAYCAFTDTTKAQTFERYLKSGSGHAFARRRLW